MSPQETQSLQDFLNQLTQVRGIVKDTQADAMIAAAVAQQPDAAYLLVQRALLVERALAESKAQVVALQNQVQALQPASAPAPGSFDNNAWGHAPGAAGRPGPGTSFTPAYTPAPAPAPASAPAQPAPQYQAAPPPSSGFFGGGAGSMLGTVAATAAGVAGGAFLFQGIEHLMNGGSGSGPAHQNAMSSPTEKVENTTVNNYYGNDGDKKSVQASGDSSSRDSDAASSNDLSDLADIDLDDFGGNDDSIA